MSEHVGAKSNPSTIITPSFGDCFNERVRKDDEFGHLTIYTEVEQALMRVVFWQITEFPNTGSKPRA